MPDLQKVIKGLECCMAFGDNYCDNYCDNCPYSLNKWECDKEQLKKDALALLKEQKPHLITEDDFANADQYGYLPAWVENHCTSEMYFECIPKHAITDPESKGEYRFWTARPTDEQRKAVKWDD